jgi:hypothetical protein
LYQALIHSKMALARPARERQGFAQVRLRVGGRQAGVLQQLIALPERDTERLAEAQHHLPAGPRRTGFEE